MLQLLCCPQETENSAAADWQPLPCGQPASGYRVSNGKVVVGPIKELQALLARSAGLNVVVKVLDAEFDQVGGTGAGVGWGGRGAGEWAGWMADVMTSAMRLASIASGCQHHTWQYRIW